MQFVRHRPILLWPLVISSAFSFYLLGTKYAIDAINPRGELRGWPVTQLVVRNADRDRAEELDASKFAYLARSDGYFVLLARDSPKSSQEVVLLKDDLVERISIQAVKHPIAR